MISLDQALQIVLQHATPLGIETIPLSESIGKVLAQSIYADRNYPPFNRAAMDGYAICKSDWDQGMRTFQVVGTLLAGSSPPIIQNAQGTALKIMTGAATPFPYDVIIKVEDSSETDQRVSFSTSTVHASQNIAREGEDLIKGQEVIAKGTEITIGALTALASVGAAILEVYRQPIISIITTGDEVIPISHTPGPYQIRNSNVATLSALLAKSGFKDVRHQHVHDSPERVHHIIADLAKHADILLLTGGVSAGAADYVPDALQREGFEKLFHKIKIKPGKPAWFGAKKEGSKVVFALPGNPLSVIATFKLLVEPYLRKCTGKDPRNYKWKQIAVNRTRRVELDEFFPYLVMDNIHGAMLEPLTLNGSGDVTATLMAAGLAQHPLETPQLQAGSFVKVFEF